jgi:hypothetical protein
MIFLTTLYNSDIRNHEFKQCIEKNCSLDVVEKYIIFFENFSNDLLKEEKFSYLNNKKIEIFSISSRPSYKEFIDFSNSNYKDNVICILNADVYFDETILKLKNIDLKNCFYCITRIHCILKTHQNPGSHDAWIFKTPLKNFDNDIKMDILGCDSYLAQKAIDAGLIVKNPCLSINLIHVHASFDPKSNTDQYLDGKNYWAKEDYRSTEIQYSEL